MKTLRWTIAFSLVGGLFAGTAMAQTIISSPVQQPGSVQQMAFQADDSAGYAVADPAVAPAPAAAGAAATPVSPSNQPPAPPAAKAVEKPAAEKPKEEEKKEEEKPPEETPYNLFHQFMGPWLDCEHLDIRGYIEAGYTSNPTYPMSGFNGPDGYNDLSNTVVLDQFYMIAERVAKVENDCGIDYGYRADVMYGTDAHFVSDDARHGVGQQLERRQPLLRPGHAPVVRHLAIQQVDAPRRPLLRPLRL